MGLETVVCAVSAEGCPAMNDLIVESARELSALKAQEGYHLIGRHVGSNEGPVYQELYDAYDSLEVHPSPGKNPVALSTLLIRGFRSALREARKRHETKAIMYTEGDKPSFISFIPKIVAPVLDDRADIVVAERSRRGFSNFPLVQRLLERRVDRAVAQEVGAELHYDDYTYGPRAFNVGSSSFFEEYPHDDWGILTYGVVAASRFKHIIQGVAVPGFPEENHMRKYGPIFKIPGAHLVWRLIQNLPHLKVVKEFSVS